ncbi:MAG: hypothetical protein SVX38_11790 [Chloroflexota bacterium]|nr:hypothetical protein [Chloroflexota bacterium]
MRRFKFLSMSVIFMLLVLAVSAGPGAVIAQEPSFITGSMVVRGTRAKQVDCMQSQASRTSTNKRAQASLWEENSKGVWTYIETADPPIRDGGFSSVRCAVAKNVIDCVSFAETGWVKDPNGIRVYASWRDRNCNYNHAYFDTLPPGYSLHSYMVEYRGDDKWGFFFDDVLKRTQWLGWSKPHEQGSGGEVSSFQNGMGVSGCLDNRYKGIDDVWRLFPSHFTHVDPPYHLVDLSAWSWQVYGNN